MALIDENKDFRRQLLRKQGGAWLRSLREAAGLTQKELSTLLDLKIPVFISQIESGRGRIPFDKLGDWARALKVDEYEFTAKALSYYEPAIFEIMVIGASKRANTNL